MLRDSQSNSESCLVVETQKEFKVDTWKVAIALTTQSNHTKVLAALSTLTTTKH
jgi:hypothetical protein